MPDFSSLASLALAATLGAAPAGAARGPAPAPAVAPAPAPGDTLRGRVTDDKGAPVPGARVEVVEWERWAVTDSAGAFVLAGIPRGHYTVVVRRLGYAPERRLVVLPAAELTVAMREAAVAIEAVTVTATREPLDPLASPLPASALSEERLRRETSISLAHALEQMPGVRTLSTGQQVGKPVIRGLSGARVLVADNGARLEDYSWSDEDAPSVDARLAERVEVIRGPASVLYGSDAIGGVINVVPRPIFFAEGGRGWKRGEAEAYVGSGNFELGAHLTAEGAGERLGWRAGGVVRHAADIHTPGGEVPNTGFLSASGEGALGMRGRFGVGTLRFSHYGGEFKLLEAGKPAEETGNEEEEEGPERKLLDDRLQLSLLSPIGGVRLETRVQFQRHALQELADSAELGDGGAVTNQGPTAQAEEGKKELVVFDLLLNTLTADVLAHHQLGRRVTGTAGVSGYYQTNDSRGPIALVPDARLSSAAAFLFERVDLGMVSLLAGVRAEGRHLDADENEALEFAGDTRTHKATTGDVGIVLRPTQGLALTANLGRAWRAPTLFELYANGPLLAETRFEVGDAELRPETSTNVDAGVRWRGGRVRAEVDGFRNAVDHFVFLAPTDAEEDELRVFRYEQARATLWGGEASLEADIAAPITVRARYDFVRGTNEDADEPLPRIPPARTTLGVEWHTAMFSWAQRAFVEGETEIVSRKTHVSPQDVSLTGPLLGTGGYALLNLGAGFDTHLAGRGARVDLRARNLTNARYRSFLSRYRDFALDPGVNVVLRVGLTL